MLPKHWKTLKKPLQRNQLSFSQDFRGNLYIMSLRSASFPQKILQKLFISQAKQKNSGTRFCRRKLAEEHLWIWLAPFCSSKLVHFFKLSFREKQVLSFALVDKWNENNSIENFTFLLCFMIRIKFFNTKERKTVSPLIS